MVIEIILHLYFLELLLQLQSMNGNVQNRIIKQF